MQDVLIRAQNRRAIAEHILTELDLPAQWSRVGKCSVVGSVALDLVVRPDIDLEIFMPQLLTDPGFEILRQCARHPQVKKARFWNAAGPPHYGHYWQVLYDHDGESWNIDMWAMADSYNLPCGSRLTPLLQRALTDPSKRIAILRLKEAVYRELPQLCPSVQIYRAVLDDEVDSLPELKAWLQRHPPADVVTDWTPRH